jgi:hypothetical protein
MNVAQAAYLVAHEARTEDGKIGFDVLAEMLGITSRSAGQILRNKVDLNNSVNHLTLKEAVRMTDLANDNRILEAWAAERNCVLVALPKVDEHCDNEELLSKFTQILGDLGELASTHREAIKDGVVNDRERHDLEHVAAAAHRHIQELLTLTFRIYCPSSAAEK